MRKNAINIDASGQYLPPWPLVLRVFCDSPKFSPSRTLLLSFIFAPKNTINVYEMTKFVLDTQQQYLKIIIYIHHAWPCIMYNIDFAITSRLDRFNVKIKTFFFKTLQIIWFCSLRRAEMTYNCIFFKLPVSRKSKFWSKIAGFENYGFWKLPVSKLEVSRISGFVNYRFRNFG